MAGSSECFLSVIVLFVYLYSSSYLHRIFIHFDASFLGLFMNAALLFINDSHGRKKGQYFLNFTHCLLESICSSQGTLSLDHVILTNQVTTKHAQSLCALLRLRTKKIISLFRVLFLFFIFVPFLFHAGILWIPTSFFSVPSFYFHFLRVRISLYDGWFSFFFSISRVRVLTHLIKPLTIFQCLLLDS